MYVRVHIYVHMSILYMYVHTNIRMKRLHTSGSRIVGLYPSWIIRMQGQEPRRGELLKWGWRGVGVVEACLEILVDYSYLIYCTWLHIAIYIYIYTFFSVGSLLGPSVGYGKPQGTAPNQ